MERTGLAGAAARFIAVLASLFLWIGTAAATESPECRPLESAGDALEGAAGFERGLLWKVSRPGLEASHVYGTIHVADDAVVRIPEPVTSALRQSSVFVMEVIPDPMEMMLLSSRMFFSDGRRLNELVSDSLYDRALEILDSYRLPREVIATMKPWAAYLTMSYPPDLRPVLDLRLLESARSLGLEEHGLETLEEQGSIFSDMPLDDQLTLLADTVCHYEVMSADFERMKELYLARDLKGLYQYGQRHTFADNRVYEDLADRLLYDRNQVMAERMRPLLEKGGAFVAIGAMHLPGKEGVLSLLRRGGFTVSSIY